MVNRVTMLASHLQFNLVDGIRESKQGLSAVPSAIKHNPSKFAQAKSERIEDLGLDASRSIGEGMHGVYCAMASRSCWLSP